MKDKIIEILNKYQTTDKPEFTDKFIDPFSFHKIAEEISQLYSAGEEVEEKYLIQYFDYVSDCDYEDTAGEFDIKDFTKAWLKSNPLLPRPTVSEGEIEEVLYNNSAGEWKTISHTMLDELRVEPTVAAIKELLNR